MLKANWYKRIGMGPTAFNNVYFSFYNPKVSRVMHAHNLLLQIFLELGIGGFISFVILILSNVKANFVSYIKTKDGYYKNIFSAVIYSIIAIMIFGAVEYVWYYPRVMLTFWLVMGLSFGANKLAASE